MKIGKFKTSIMKAIITYRNIFGQYKDRAVAWRNENHQANYLQAMARNGSKLIGIHPLK